MKHRCWTEIDLFALNRNLQAIRRALPKEVAYWSVVKADAYGHGLPQVVAALMRAGADGFAVANVEEASRIREMGRGWPILLLSSVLPEEEESVLELDLTPTLSSVNEVERFEALCQRKGAQLGIHLKVDTGMGRLGIWHTLASELLERIRKSPFLRLLGIYTHFSRADSDPEFTAEQRNRFISVLMQLNAEEKKDLLIHADNSAGLESFQGRMGFNAVRVGLLQFGIRPYSASLLENVHVQTVLSFHTKVGLVKNLPKGAQISYGGTFCMEQPGTVAILTAGYGDGIPISASNRGYVLIRGHRCPILGRVTMDQTIVGVDAIAGKIQAGDQATLIGKQEEEEIRVTDFAQWGNTIPWDAFCSITKRVERLYTELA